MTLALPAYNPIWDLREGNTIEQNTLRLLNEINSAIIQFRGNYSAWCKAHGIGYNEMLVMYSIREKGYCTQKQICDQYLLHRQTINHVTTPCGNRRAWPQAGRGPLR